MSKRIATNRNFLDNSVEYIELNDNGVFYWVAEDYGNIFYSDKTVQRWMPEDIVVSSSFPVNIDFVKDFFEKIGRQFDLTKLPSNVVLNPYE